MYYWRKDSFEKLDGLSARLGDEPELADYIRYTSLLASGLRKQALQHIDDLIASLRSLPKERQRALASLLCQEADDQSGHRVLPDPLTRHFIQPVLEDWRISDPSNPEPFRWTGVLADLIRAVELDPACDKTRLRLVKKILQAVGYATHELPVGYLGIMEEDYALLRIAMKEMALLPNAELRAKLARSVADEIHAIDEYVTRKTS